jgi:hypothetical protein
VTQTHVHIFDSVGVSRSVYHPCDCVAYRWITERQRRSVNQPVDQLDDNFRPGIADGAIPQLALYRF